MTLIGRKRERAALDRLLGAARAGTSGVLVVHGEPGVGKTALLNVTVENALGFHTALTHGVEGEMEMPFSAAHELCSEFASFVDRLPAPQIAAIRVAFGFDPGPPPDPFLVGLAIFGLLSEAAEDEPILAVIDDAQWLDPASARALAFVARRLLAERVALVFVTREIGNSFARLPDLPVEPLGLHDSRSLLRSILPGPLDEHVVDRLIQEARGNPLALIELPHGLTTAQLAGGFGLPVMAPVAECVEESFKRRLADLPRAARRLLLLAAAEPTGDPVLLWRAAVHLGIPDHAAETVESDGLLSFGPQVTFRHPLVRSAVYNASELDERHKIHRALAEATDPKVDPDRRSWHFAQAAVGPDEDIASALERLASRAQARGGLAAAAAFLERAAALTPDSIRHGRRAISAAQVLFEAGALEESIALMDQTQALGLLDEEGHSRMQLVRAQIEFASNHGNDATALLLAAAQNFERLEPNLARATYLEALSAAKRAGRLASTASVAQVGAAALAGPPMPEFPSPSDLLLQGLSIRFTAGYAAGAPLLKEAIRAFVREPVLPPVETRWLWFAGVIALEMWDDAAWMVLSTRQLELARKTGALSALPFILPNRISTLAFFGDLEQADALEVELSAVTEATEIAAVRFGALALAALRGRESEFSELSRTTVSEARARGEGIVLSIAEFFSGGFHNGGGRFDAALAAVAPCEEVNDDAQAIWALTELVEAAVRCGDVARARRAFERVRETTLVAGTDWGSGIEARCHALISEGAEADELYRTAISHLSRTNVRVQLARTHLLYGEWLRNEHRRLDAREHLQIAYDLFRTFGVEGFIERARVELEAAGGFPHRGAIDRRDQLTAQEAEISRLVAVGHTNREIAARLFISPSAVEYHLHKIFRKLDVESRVQLARRLS